MGTGRFGGDGKFLELDIGDGPAAWRIVLNATESYAPKGRIGGFYTLRLLPRRKQTASRPARPEEGSAAAEDPEGVPSVTARGVRTALVHTRVWKRRQGATPAGALCARAVPRGTGTPNDGSLRARAPGHPGQGGKKFFP